MNFFKKLVGSYRSMKALGLALAFQRTAQDVFERPENPATQEELLQVLAKALMSRKDVSKMQGPELELTSLANTANSIVASECLMFMGKNADSLEVLDLAKRELNSSFKASKNDSSGPLADLLRDVLKSLDGAALTIELRRINADESIPAAERKALIMPMAHALDKRVPEAEAKMKATAAVNGDLRKACMGVAALFGECALAFHLAGDDESARARLMKALVMGGGAQLTRELGDSFPVPYKQAHPASYVKMVRDMAHEMGMSPSTPQSVPSAKASKP